MDFEFINVGPIDNVKINLEKDLTFVYGKNSIGKSYAITLTYLILKNFSSTYIDKYFMSLIPIQKLFGETYLKTISDKIDNMSTTVDITEYVIDFISEYIFFAFIKPLEESIISSFGSVENLNNRISKKSFLILLHFKNYVFEISEKDNG